MRHIDVPCDLDFMAVSSYGSATDSSGVVRILKDLDAPLQGRHVLIVEDIVDSGLTLQYLLRNLGARNPAR
jgi:hypoxanthine phosphoribosyltransferase